MSLTVIGYQENIILWINRERIPWEGEFTLRSDFQVTAFTIFRHRLLGYKISERWL